MERDYQDILSGYGFDQIPDAEDTVLAFYHEINNTLLDEESPFDVGASFVQQMPGTLDHMIQCSLPLKKGVPLEQGIQYLMSTWYSELAYKNTKFEQVQRNSSPFGEEIRILAMIEHGACSFLFTVCDDVAQKNAQSFMDGYDPVDNADELLQQIEAAQKKAVQYQSKEV